MPLTVLSSTDIHSLLLSLNREDIAELQYVTLAPIFLLVNQTMRLDPSLETTRSRGTSPSFVYTHKQAMLI